MKLSVVIPVYNEAATLEQLLSRVQAAPFEKQLVIVDDASTDGSREILRRMEKGYPDLTILLSFLPFAGVKVSHRNWVLISFAIAYLLVWFFTSQQARFLLLILPTGALLAAQGIRRAGEFGGLSRRVSRGVLALQLRMPYYLDREFSIVGLPIGPEEVASLQQQGFTHFLTIHDRTRSLLMGLGYPILLDRAVSLSRSRSLQRSSASRATLFSLQERSPAWAP